MKDAAARKREKQERAQRKGLGERCCNAPARVGQSMSALCSEAM